MMVSMDGADVSIDSLRGLLNVESEKMGVSINIMAEKVFSSMNRI